MPLMRTSMVMVMIASTKVLFATSPFLTRVIIIIIIVNSITIKVLFATAPPPGKGSGWPCFWVSLIYIGACACVIRSDLKNCHPSIVLSVFYALSGQILTIVFIIHILCYPMSRIVIMFVVTICLCICNYEKKTPDDFHPNDHLNFHDLQ